MVITLRQALHWSFAVSIGVTFGALTGAFALGCAIRLFLWTLNMGWVLG